MPLIFARTARLQAADWRIIKNEIESQHHSGGETMSGDAKKKSKVILVIGIAAALLILLVLVVPFLLDANQFRPQLETKLSTALGRDVKVGNLKLSLLSGSVVVDDISIADNPAFSHNPFVTAKSLKVGIQLKPLIFSKVIHVTAISLDKPIITLVRAATGKWNFSDLGRKFGTAKAKPAGQGTGGFQEKDFSIEKLKITGGRVTVVHTGRAKPSVYDDVSITASDLSLISAFPFSLTALLPGSGSLKLEGKAGPLNSED
jgi:AsmA protein